MENVMTFVSLLSTFYVEIFQRPPTILVTTRRPLLFILSDLLYELVVLVPSTKFPL